MFSSIANKSRGRENVYLCLLTGLIWLLTGGAGSPGLADVPAMTKHSASTTGNKVGSSTEKCWKPAFAGFWYARDPSELHTAMHYWLDEARRNSTFQTSFPELIHDQSHVSSPASGESTSTKSPEDIIAAIVPHASYEYSGFTAARVYSALSEHKYSRIFIMGPAHREHFHGCGLPVTEALCTPLGKLPVDTAVVRKLRKLPLFGAPYDAPRKEHSIEIQLPMIQQTFGSIPIVPIEVGNLKNQDEIAEVARSLKKFVTANDLVLVSSDFTHYGPRYHFQPFLGDPLNRIKKMDAVAYDCIARGDLNQFVQFEKRTHDTICGYYPCAVLIAMLPPDCSARLLNYEISSRIHKVPEGNMVSYLGIVISRKAGTASR